MKKIILPLILYTLYPILCATPTHAVSTGLSISPPVTEILIAPNKSTVVTITISNQGEDTYYQASLHKLIPTDELGHSTIDPTPLNLTQLPVTPKLIGQSLNTLYPLASNQSHNLTLQLDAGSVDVPTDLYLALILKTSDDQNLESPNTSTISPAIAALLLTTIAPIPAIPTDIQLVDFAPPTFHDNSQPLTLTPSARNNANIMLRIKGQSTLTSPSGKIIHTTNLDPTLILGSSTRALSPITYPLFFQNIGPHRLTYHLSTDGGRTLLEASHVVWLLPIRASLILVLGIIILTTLKIRQNRLTSQQKKD